jgi:arylsulfatase A-like enzyme
MTNFLLFLLLPLLCAPFTAVGAGPGSPNIVLVMCDDLGWGDTGFNGNKVIRTPHLDNMAAGGLRFTRFYAAAPVCSPTRGSVLTGRHPYRYGIYFANTGHMKDEETTLAELLRKKGYRTGHFGKWHVGTLTKTVAARAGSGTTHLHRTTALMFASPPSPRSRPGTRCGLPKNTPGEAAARTGGSRSRTPPA